MLLRVFKNPSLIGFVQGGFGVDFSQDVRATDISRVAEGILAHGVTAFCPTLVTSPPEVYHKVCEMLRVCFSIITENQFI